MVKKNILESLKRLDRASFCRYDLSALYESCNLTEEEENKLVNYISTVDIEGMNNMLTNASSKFCENVSDDADEKDLEKYGLEKQELDEDTGWRTNPTNSKEVRSYVYRKIKPSDALTSDDSRYWDFDYSISNGDDAVLATNSRLPKSAKYQFSTMDDNVDIDFYLDRTSDNDTWYIVDNLPDEDCEVKEDDKLDEATATLERPLSNFEGTLGNVMSAHQAELSQVYDRQSAFEFLDSIEPEVKNKNYLNTVKSNLMRMPDRKVTKYLYDIILKGDGMGSKLESLEEDVDFSVYDLTPEQIELAKQVSNNLNKAAGYRAFYELEKDITDNGGDDSVLYDLAADFNWDIALNVALNKLAMAEDRTDLVDPDFLPGGPNYEYMTHPDFENILEEGWGDILKDGAKKLGNKIKNSAPVQAVKNAAQDLKKAGQTNTTWDGMVSTMKDLRGVRAQERQQQAAEKKKELDAEIATKKVELDAKEKAANDRVAQIASGKKPQSTSQKPTGEQSQGNQQTSNKPSGNTQTGKPTTFIYKGQQIDAKTFNSLPSNKKRDVTVIDDKGNYIKRGRDKSVAGKKANLKKKTIWVAEDLKNHSFLEAYDFNRLRDDSGKLMADKWYEDVYPEDNVGVEQLSGLFMDDLLKDRSPLDDMDTQVRDRVNKQLDRYSPIIRESKSINEESESKNRPARKSLRYSQEAYDKAFDFLKDATNNFTKEGRFKLPKGIDDSACEDILSDYYDKSGPTGDSENPTYPLEVMAYRPINETIDNSEWYVGDSESGYMYKGKENAQKAYNNLLRMGIIDAIMQPAEDTSIDTEDMED